MESGKISKDYSSLFYDAKAVELIEKIDYDFSTHDKAIQRRMFNIYRKAIYRLLFARAKQFDDKIRAYIREHPRASVVNIGCRT